MGASGTQQLLTSTIHCVTLALFAVGENGTIVCIVGVLYGTITVRINSPITMLTKFPCVKVTKIGKQCKGAREAYLHLVFS